MEAAVVFVRELERGPADIHQLDLVCRTETHIGAFAGVDVTDDRLHKGAQIPRGPMLHIDHDGDVAIVFNRLSFSKIVRCGHK